MKKRFIRPPIIVLFVFIIFSYSAFARVNNDKIKIINYQQDEIIELTGTHFFATNIEFDKKEKLQEIYVGDQIAWTYSLSSKQPHLLFIKPTLDKSDTNMAIITTAHVYHFHLVSDKNNPPSTPTYHLRIKLLPAQESINKPKTGLKKMCVTDQKHYLNTHYQWSGSHTILPTHVSDDGMFTYFKFSSDKPLPAIFALEEDKEKLINTENHHDFIIAKCLAKKFLLVHNGDQAWVERSH